MGQRLVTWYQAWLNLVHLLCLQQHMSPLACNAVVPCFWKSMDCVTNLSHLTGSCHIQNLCTTCYTLSLKRTKPPHRSPYGYSIVPLCNTGERVCVLPSSSQNHFSTWRRSLVWYTSHLWKNALNASDRWLWTRGPCTWSIHHRHHPQDWGLSRWMGKPWSITAYIRSWMQLLHW